MYYMFLHGSANIRNFSAFKKFLTSSAVPRPVTNLKSHAEKYARVVKIHPIRSEGFRNGKKSQPTECRISERRQLWIGI